MRRVTEPLSSLSWLPIMEAAIRVRPRAAVATGSVLWICRARSTISLAVITDAFTGAFLASTRMI